MKTISFRTGAALLSLFLFLPGCLDIYLTTQLFPNGEIEKTILIKGDSTDLESAPFYFMQDTGWTRKDIRVDDDKPALSLTRKFSSFKELNKSMNPEDTTIQVIRVKSDLKKKFRWFFTYFDYSETILKADPYKTLDWRNYLTEKELRQLKLTEDQRKEEPQFNEDEYKLIEKKYEEFVMRSAFEDYIRILFSVLKKESSYAAVQSELLNRKEELYHFMVDSSNAEHGRDLTEAVDKFLNRTDLIGLILKYPVPFKIFDDKMELWDKIGANSYKFIIRMPGILLNTNSTQVEGLETRWEFTGNDLYFDDVQLTCESRMINKWAFVVAGIVLLLAIGLAFKPRRGKTAA